MNIKKYDYKDNQKAITLIALIVTIIVLLILAGIGISMLMRRKRYTCKSKYRKKRK